MLRIFVSIMLAFCFIVVKADNVSGYIRDKNTGEALIGASVYIPELSTGTISNEYGFYFISIPEGNYQIQFSYLGYGSKIVKYEKLQLLRRLNIELLPETQTLNEIVINSYSDNEVKNINTFHTQKLSLTELSKLPTVFGEPDVIKGIQMQTGVKNTAEGSSGMYVRGGNIDQNLILIDEAPIYNPTHMFGLISVFNPDAVNNITFYKGNMPANFGGRLSSVISVQQNEGNLKKRSFSAGISTLSTRLTAQGPIVKDEISFFVSVRTSYINLFVRPNEIFTFIPSFYDINAKVNFKLSERNRLFISFYNGHDRLNSFDGLDNNWGNTTTTLRYTFNPTGKLFINTSLIYSNYKNKMLVKDNTRSTTWLTGIEDITAKIKLSFDINNQNKLSFGASSIYHQFTPGTSSNPENSIFNVNAIESAFFITHKFSLGTKFTAEAGIRWSLFQNTGNAQWYEYSYDYKKSTLKTNLSGIYNTYSGIEPRIDVVYKFNNKFSIQAGVGRNYQYYQLIANNSVSYTSIESWLPASVNLKSQYADMVSIGTSSLIMNFPVSIEAYYKKLYNQTDYVDHAQLFNNPQIEKELRIGKGKAYGIEVELKKKFNNFQGTMSYSWSRTTRKINGINNNEWYPTFYDIPHDYRIKGLYKHKRWEFSAIWLLMSGRAFTIPTGYFEYSQQIVPTYSDRNSGRFPLYHRLDASAKLLPKSQKKKIKGTLTFGIYNLYARQNPLGYQFSFEPYSGDLKLYQYNFIRILPNISYVLNF